MYKHPAKARGWLGEKKKFTQRTQRQTQRKQRKGLEKKPVAAVA